MLEDEHETAFHEEAQICRVISESYQRIFTSFGETEFSLVEEVLQPLITETMNDFLVSISLPQEVKETVFTIHCDKAPGRMVY